MSYAVDPPFCGTDITSSFDCVSHMQKPCSALPAVFCSTMTIVQSRALEQPSSFFL